MTPEAQRIAIAEACGWKQHCNNRVFGSIGGKANPSVLWPSGLPDYLNDLNAMHEAEEALTHIQQLHYTDDLMRLLNDAHRHEHRWIGVTAFHYAHATADQRAEALLRTLGKWTDQPNPTP